MHTHLADDEHVRQTCGERMADVVLDVHNIERAGMPFAAGDHANAADVVTADNHNSHAYAYRSY